MTGSFDCIILRSKLLSSSSSDFPMVSSGNVRDEERSTNSPLWPYGTEEYFNFGPPSNWFLRVTSEDLEWRTPQPNPNIVPSCFCGASPDFCGEPGGLSMFCSTCQGDSHFCQDLHLHFQYFSADNLPAVSGDITPYSTDWNSKDLAPLSFLVYFKLIANCRSIVKAVTNFSCNTVFLGWSP